MLALESQISPVFLNWVSNQAHRILNCLLFYCCEKRSWPEKLIKESISLGLWFQRVRIRDGSVEAWWWEWLDFHILNSKQKVERHSGWWGLLKQTCSQWHTLNKSPVLIVTKKTLTTNKYSNAWDRWEALH